MLTKFKPVTFPDPRLLKKSTPVQSQVEAEKIVEKMEQAITWLTWGKVSGFAAPQIGINKRVFMAQGEIYLNADIIWRSKGETYHREGCYSLEPGKYDYSVVRPQSIIMRWTSMDGESHEERFNNKKAQVIQHEYDHLEGKLCSGAGGDDE